MNDGNLTVGGALTANTATVAGAAVVTTTAAQTMTNKTLTDPLISRVYGDSAANGDLTLEGTSSATKTSSTVYMQPTGGNVGVGFSADPGQPFAVRRNNSALYISPYEAANDRVYLYAYNPVTPGDIPIYLQGSSVNLLSLGGGSVTATLNSGGFSVGGVTVPTINDTVTLTNKTLTDPLISRVYGGSAANADLTLEGTSSATKTSSYVSMQPTGGDVVVGGVTTDYNFEVQDQGASNYRITVNLNSSGENVIGSINGAVGDTTGATLRIYSPRLRLDGVVNLVTSATPASAAATGTAGDIAWNTTHLFICTATDTWKRVAIATW